MMKISGKIGIASLTDQAYLYNQQMNLMFGTSHVMVLMITVFVSTLKLWKSKKQAH
jgi:Ca2+/H+ antiporter